MELKKIRKIKGLTQKEASLILGIPLRTYKRYENDLSDKESFKAEQIKKNLMKIPVKTPQKTSKSFKISVIGAGYVGLSLAALLSIRNEVTALDIDQNKVDSINRRQNYIDDKMLDKMFADNDFKLKAMCVNKYHFDKDDIVLIATNTDFDSKTGQFNLSSVNESVSRIRKENPNCLIVIKSTVSLGFTKSLNDKNIIFVPEFLTEGNAIHDNLFPSRIIIGADCLSNKIKNFARCLTDISLNNKDVIYMSSNEAEAVKLFSNAYLAMRVAYFNELDTYAETNNLNSLNIIKGVSLDPRIGDYYNNPSFGYGGYCLPKDTAELENSFLHIDNNNIIKAIVESNTTRKEYIANQIINLLSSKDQTIGFYKLSMKKDSNNYRNSSSLDILNILINKGYKVVVYDKNYQSKESVNDFDEFISKSNIVVANRISDELKPYANKVYTRDLFKRC